MKVRYDAPGKWCSYCWADWWFDGEGTEDGKGAGTKREKYIHLVKMRFRDILDDLKEWHAKHTQRN